MMLTLFPKPFTEATHRMSQARSPTLPFVIPTYHNLALHLAEWRSFNPSVPVAIRAAASAGHDKLQVYKAKADNNYYCITATGAYSVMVVVFTPLGLLMVLT